MVGLRRMSKLLQNGLAIEVEFEGTGETVKKQSVRTNTALKNIQKIKITLGD